MKKLLYIFLTTAVLLLVVGYSYVNDYYRPNDYALLAMENSENVAVVKEDNVVAYIPENSETGIIFYQGGKVDENAYAPLLKKLAENGILCVEPFMPYNLAVLGVDKADGIIEKYPNVKHWYMMGHSLGGSMAGAYIAKHADEFDGIILLAAYVTNDISDTQLKSLSIYGDKDGVLSMEKYLENQVNLHQSDEKVIKGGNHANFGCYGQQKGDGVRDVTDIHQIDETVNIITEWLEN